MSNLPYKVVFKQINCCLQETRKEFVNTTIDKIKSRNTWKSKIDLLFFAYPLISLIAITAIFLILAYAIAYLIGILPDNINILIRPIVCIISIVIYLALAVLFSIILDRTNQKYKIEQEDLYDGTINSYLSQIKHDRGKVKRDFTAARGYYRRESKFIKIVVSFFAGLFIGCLANKDFQIALLKMSLEEMFESNPFGTVCTILSPFIFICYSLYYKRPINIMNNVLSALEKIPEPLPNLKNLPKPLPK
jgi:membrane protein implicated in regulation of membrane protease activity